AETEKDKAEKDKTAKDDAGGGKGTADGAAKPDGSDDDGLEEDDKETRDRFAAAQARRRAAEEEAAQTDADGTDGTTGAAAADTAAATEPDGARQTSGDGQSAEGVPEWDEWDEADAKAFRDQLAWEAARRDAEAKREREEAEQRAKEWEEILRAEALHAEEARRAEEAAERAWQETGTPTPHVSGRYARPPKRPEQRDDIHEGDFREAAEGWALPPAPQPHTQRPGTTRPRHKEEEEEGDSVSEPVTHTPSASTPSASGGLAAQHQTEITFDEYLMCMARTALKAADHQERAETLMEAIGKIADALRDMAADLVGDHNISTAVTNLITDLADSADRMKQQAGRCAQQCALANESARLAAVQVARVYGQDMAAKEDAGLTYVSAAAHHD
ncbi:ATP/GTP-binding protein, partial [Streptomyces sp. NPDC055210]